MNSYPTEWMENQCTWTAFSEVLRVFNRGLAFILKLTGYFCGQIMLHVVAPEFGDDSDILIELSAGAGGQEAMLFTGEMYEMYVNYAAYKGWSVEEINSDLSPVGEKQLES